MTFEPSKGPGSAVALQLAKSTWLPEAALTEAAPAACQSPLSSREPAGKAAPTAPQNSASASAVPTFVPPQSAAGRTGAGARPRTARWWSQLAARRSCSSAGFQSRLPPSARRRALCLWADCGPTKYARAGSANCCSAQHSDWHCRWVPWFPFRRLSCDRPPRRDT